MIVLAYNDAESLQDLLPRVHEALTSLSGDVEVIVVDDGSVDDTAAVVARVLPESMATRLITHAVNRGVGAAFWTGVEAARFDHLGYIDGDGQYDPADLVGMVPRLEGNTGVVSGQRVQRADPYHRRVISYGYRHCLRVLYGVTLMDVNSGIKVFTRSALQHAVPPHSRSPFFDAEVVITAAHAGTTVEEVPVAHHPRRFGRAGGVRLPALAATWIDMVADTMASCRRRTWSANGLTAVCRLAGRLCTSVSK